MMDDASSPIMLALNVSLHNCELEVACKFLCIAAHAEEALDQT